MSLSNKALNVVRDYLLITIGTVLFTISWEFFIIPNNFSSGGLTGLCTIVQYATKGLIPVSLSYSVINILLILIAFAILGKGVGVRTIYCIALCTLLFQVFSGMESFHAVEGNFLYVPEKVLIPIISGLLESVGLGIILRFGGSSGGTDIIALIINKYWPVSMGKVFFITDLVITASIMILPDKAFADMVYGLVMMITFALTVDYVILGGKSTVQLLVFSEKYDKIADYVNSDLERGVTALSAVGWYTKQEKRVLLILIRKKQLHDVTKAIKAIDQKAFVSVSPASSVYGEGFEEMKTGIKRKKVNR